MNKALTTWRDRVITLNKQCGQGSDVQTAKWVRCSEGWIQDNHDRPHTVGYLPGLLLFLTSLVPYGIQHWIVVGSDQRASLRGVFIPVDPKRVTGRRRSWTNETPSTTRNLSKLSSIMKGRSSKKEGGSTGLSGVGQRAIHAREELLKIDNRMKRSRSYGHNYVMQMTSLSPSCRACRSQRRPSCPPCRPRLRWKQKFYHPSMLTNTSKSSSHHTKAGTRSASPQPCL